jgi:hypothetical protein
MLFIMAWQCISPEVTVEGFKKWTGKMKGMAVRTTDMSGVSLRKMKA